MDERIKSQLKIYDSLTREKKVFEPLNESFVGMYVCGPTVYNHVHLGNCRTFTSFDVIFRYLKFLGYTVRYVRNITDVGHLVNDADEGEDKIAKEAKANDLEPMEVVQKYTSGFHQIMRELNNLSPSIEPTATGHIIEQIEMAKALLEKGLAYEVNGSVYFDVEKYHEQKHYGRLSGRKIEELATGQREIEGTKDKKSPLDFALWKKAIKGHIMRWPSPWGEGFPGWHIECSAMGKKYLGEVFDIHGGGMDLKFPHHECEIAQASGVTGQDPVQYWMHTNMLTVNGQRMGKSVGNAILPQELFKGDHELLDKAYSPMVLRFAMLQTHYRSTMDLSNDALRAAEKGYKRLINALNALEKLTTLKSDTQEIDNKLDEEINKLVDTIFHGLNDDFNTARAIASLFNLVKKINGFYTGQLNLQDISNQTFNRTYKAFKAVFFDILGLKVEAPADAEKLIENFVNEYKKAKSIRDFEAVDRMREYFKENGLAFRDMKEKIDWVLEE